MAAVAPLGQTGKRKGAEDVRGRKGERGGVSRAKPLMAQRDNAFLSPSASSVFSAPLRFPRKAYAVPEAVGTCSTWASRFASQVR